MSVGATVHEQAVFPHTDRYRNLGIVGRGATGTVFRALDLEFHREVALKVLSGTTPDDTRALKWEFRSVRDVAHRNLVRLFELDTTGHPFLTMELLDGVDFVSWVRADVGRAPASLHQILQGVEALHRSGVVHRDIKPANVLVTADGRVVVLDLGFSARTRPWGAFRDQIRGIAGTPRYMAPELLVGGAPGPASDLYAVGLMLFEALGGELPNARDWTELYEWKRRRGVRPPGGSDALSNLAWRLIEPDPSKRPTLDEALSACAPAGSRSTSFSRSPPFVGRNRELALLSRAVEVARGGGAPVVEVRGESGAGKTRLMSEFVRSLGESAVVLAGRCHPNERVAYRALDGVIADLEELLRSPRLEREVRDCLDSVDPALFHLFPALRRAARRTQDDASEGPGPRLLQRAITALRAVLARLATRETPLVLWIDDAQWAGEDGAALVRDLLTLPDEMCILTLLVTRPDTRATLPAALAGIVDEVLEIAPLTEGASTTLLSGLALERSTAARIARDAAGNPYVLIELARACHEVGGDLSTDFGTVVDERIARVGPPARRLLERLAVAGRPVRPAELDEVGASALSPLQAESLVRVEGFDDERGFVPFHDRVRAHVLGRLTPTEVIEHHRHLAGGLLEMPSPPPDLVVVHLRAAGDVDRAYPFAMRAAEAASEALAFSRSVTLFREALELAPESERAERRRALADALACAGFGEEAASHFLALAGQGDDQASLELEQRAAEQLLFSGHQRRGADILRSALHRVGETMPRSRLLAFGGLLWRALHLPRGRVPYAIREPAEWTAEELRRIDVLHTASLGLSMSEAILSSALGLRHLDAAVGAGEPGRLARAIAIQLAQLAAFRYDPEQTRALAEQASEFAEASGSAESIALVRIAAATAAWMECRFEDCYQLASQIGDALETETPGLRFHRDSAQIVMLAGLLHTGRWRELCSSVPDILIDATRRGDLYLAVNVKVRYGAARWIARDDPQRALAEIADGERSWPRTAFDLTDLFAVTARATVLLYDDRPDDALAALDRAMPKMRRSFLLSSGFLRTLVVDLCARATLARGVAHRKRLRAAEVRRFGRILRRIGSPLAAVRASCLEAEVAASSGALDAAQSSLRQARAQYEALGMRMDAAAATLRLATLDRDDERAESSLRVMSQLGARRPWKLARTLFPTLGAPL